MSGNSSPLFHVSWLLPAWKDYTWIFCKQRQEMEMQIWMAALTLIFSYLSRKKRVPASSFNSLFRCMHACMHEIPLDPVPKIKLHGTKVWTHYCTTSITFTQELISSDTVSHIKYPNVNKAASCIFLIHLFNKIGKMSIWMLKRKPNKDFETKHIKLIREWPFLITISLILDLLLLLPYCTWVLHGIFFLGLSQTDLVPISYSHFIDRYMWRTKNKAARKPTVPSIRKKP